MSTNFYSVTPISTRQRQQLNDHITASLPSADTPYSDDLRHRYTHIAETILASLPTPPIHLGKRSVGWQFLWDYHQGRYYKPNLASIKAYLQDKIIIDEYHRTYTLDQFLQEIDHCLYQSPQLRDGIGPDSPPNCFISQDHLWFSYSEDFR